MPAGTVLSARPGWGALWDSLSEQDKQVATRFMECFARFLSHADEMFARLGEIGGPLSHNKLPVGLDHGPAVGTGYTAPFRFLGTIRRA